jgi:predicted enzyme related to lactoylglutathione lyase
MIERLTLFALTVEDMQSEVEFYTDTLGLKINEQETVPGNYTQFELESVAGLALIHGLDQDGADEPYDIALKVKEADEFHRQLLEKGVAVVSEPRDIPWGRTFLFRTPAGHLLRAYSSPEREPGE